MSESKEAEIEIQVLEGGLSSRCALCERTLASGRFAVILKVDGVAGLVMQEDIACCTLAYQVPWVSDEETAALEHCGVIDSMLRSGKKVQRIIMPPPIVGRVKEVKLQ